MLMINIFEILTGKNKGIWGVSGTRRVRDERRELLSLVCRALTEQTGAAGGGEELGKHRRTCVAPACSQLIAISLQAPFNSCARWKL